MSAIYDNWERIVMAVLRKEELWEPFHVDSIDPSEEFSSPSLSSSFSYQESLKKEKYVEVVSYKMVTDNGIATVVKRLREEEEEGDHEVIRDENECYFCYEDEMLLIYEYQMSKDLVSNVMHGKKVENYSLDWESRLRIAICIAKAIANIHSQGNKKLIKFPNKHITDLRLRNEATTSIVFPTRSYRAPEINDSCKLSQSSDVYSFGVLLIELLTGITFPTKGNVVKERHLVRWITQRFHEVGTLIVYEFVPVNNHNELIEMWKMLLVAIRCVEEDVKKRPELMSDVVLMMENVRILHPSN